MRSSPLGPPLFIFSSVVQPFKGIKCVSMEPNARQRHCTKQFLLNLLLNRGFTFSGLSLDLVSKPFGLSLDWFWN